MINIHPMEMMFVLGKDQHKRNITLRAARSAGNQWTWSISREAYSQRDEKVTIDDIPAEALIMAGRCVEATIKSELNHEAASSH